MFKTIGDYLVPLMRLMDGLPERQEAAWRVLNRFEKRYGEQIPSEHRRSLSKRDPWSGTPIWERNVRMIRQKALRLKLMDAPARGIWRLTEKGHVWLAENPEAMRFDGRAKTRAPKKQPRPARRHRISRDAYREFYGEIEARLAVLLPDTIRNAPHHFQMRANRWQMLFDAFGGCHYQITLRREYHEIALHFESTRLASHARLNAFQPRVAELTMTLGETVQAGTMGTRGSWARVWLARKVEALNQSLASEYAAQLARFITATFPILQTTSRTIGKHKTERGNSASRTADNPAYPLLDREIELVRAFLAGRSDHRPSDEKICDWIQFCYWFELHAEGRDLYKLISADGVNPWYFERTRKLAKICELRAIR